MERSRIVPLRSCPHCGRVARTSPQGKACLDCNRVINPLKKLAHRLVNRAVLKGRLPAPKTLRCACGARAKDYDHRDYLRPMAVEATCHPCNLKRPPAGAEGGPWIEHFYFHGELPLVDQWLADSGRAYTAMLTAPPQGHGHAAS